MQHYSDLYAEQLQAQLERQNQHTQGEIVMKPVEPKRSDSILSVRTPELREDALFRRDAHAFTCPAETSRVAAAAE